MSSVNAKDILMVAAAMAADCAYLLTLDKGLLREANQACLGFVTPLPGNLAPYKLCCYEAP